MCRVAVEIDNLTKVFKPPLRWVRRLLRRPCKNEVIALSDIHLSIQQGEIIGVVGRNGHGKTTLVKSIASLLVPTSGSVRVFGLDSVKKNREVKQRIGLVTSDERSFYWRLTGRQNMMFFARLQGMEETISRRKIDDLFDTFDLETLSDLPFREYSNGNKQRLAIVRALLTDPPLMLFDEPTRSLDPILADDLRQLIKERINASGDKTVLFTSHNLSEVEELCTRVAILSQGVLKACAPINEMQDKFYGREQVLLKVRSIPGEDELNSLRNRVPDLVWERQPDRMLELRFKKHAEDEKLHQVLSRLLALDAEIVSCDTKRLGLKEIIMEIESQD